MMQNGSASVFMWEGEGTPYLPANGIFGEGI